MTRPLRLATITSFTAIAIIGIANEPPVRQPLGGPVPDAAFLPAVSGHLFLSEQFRPPCSELPGRYRYPLWRSGFFFPRAPELTDRTAARSTGAGRGACSTQLLMRPGCPDLRGEFQDNRIRNIADASEPFAALVSVSTAHGHGDSSGETHEYERFTQGHGNE